MKKILWKPNNNEGNLLTFGKGAYGSKNSAATISVSFGEKTKEKEKLTGFILSNTGHVTRSEEDF